MNILILVAAANLQTILIEFLVLVVVLAIIAGLIYLIETWVIKSELPTPIKLVIGLVLIVLVVIWGLRAFGGGGT
jgi:hypothetical protein